MNDEQPRGGPRLLLQIGAVAAIIGTIFQVGAGTLSTSLPAGGDATALEGIAGQAMLLQVIYLGFILGAIFWVWALVALATQLTEGAGWALARLAVVSAFVGATLHAVDGVLHGVALPSLATAFVATPEEGQGALLADFTLLRFLFEATWAGVILLFHGIPFVLAGLAVTLDQRHPTWLGWIGFIGGAGSVVIGLAMIFGVAPAGLAVPFAVVISAFMIILGWLMWTDADHAA